MRCCHATFLSGAAIDELGGEEMFDRCN